MSHARCFWLAVAVASTTALALVAHAQSQGISIVHTGDLSFGSIVVGGAAGTVVVSPAGARTASGGVLLGNGASVSPASFTVSGEPNTAYSLILPSSATLAAGDSTMTLDNFTVSPSGSGNLGPSGSRGLSVAATLHVSGTQARGVYTGSFAVTVTYE